MSSTPAVETPSLPSWSTSAGLLADTPLSTQDARTALATAHYRGDVTDEDYIGYMWRRVQRDDHLMRHASGALRQRTWPRLKD